MLVKRSVFYKSETSESSSFTISLYNSVLSKEFHDKLNKNVDETGQFVHNTPAVFIGESPEFVVDELALETEHFMPETMSKVLENSSIGGDSVDLPEPVDDLQEENDENIDEDAELKNLEPLEAIEVLRKRSGVRSGFGKPEKCPLCNNFYKNWNQLRQHFSTTHKEQWDKRISKQHKLSAKVKKYNSVRYKCEICGFTYNRPRDLYVHQRNKHPDFWEKREPTIRQGKRAYTDICMTCTVCDETFRDREVLERHQETDHPEFWAEKLAYDRSNCESEKCEICGEVLTATNN